MPAGQWPLLLLSALLNVTIWMTLMGLALVRLPASEATVLAYTMPIWTALMAWPILGERMTLKRVLALLMAFAGIFALMGGDGFAASMAKLPGIVMILVGAIAFGARHRRRQAGAEVDADPVVVGAAARHRLGAGRARWG